jgi:hypothetical protein
MKTDGRGSIQSIGIMLALLLMAIGTICTSVFGQQPTLYAPTGARLKAMGGCGYALSDDETALFYNPAGLGLKNDRWNGGALYYSTLNYYYSLNSTYYGIAYQNENMPKLGFSFYLNRFGYIDDPEENTVAIGCGYNFFSDDLMSNSIGAAIKYYHYRFGYDDQYGAGGWREDVHTTPVAFDVGYLLQFIDRVRIGFVLKNIGPDITGAFNDSTKQKRKLPLIFATGCGFKNNFDFENLRVLNLSSGLSFSSLLQDFGY